jgi:membrane protein
VRLLQFAAIVAKGFVRDRLLLRASALTYFTLLSIIPLLAIVGSVATALGVTENVVETIVAQFADAFPQIAERTLEFVENANIAGLGTLGAATLFLTTVLGIKNVESALNHIWGVRQGRSWSRRLPDYLAVLVVAPLLLGTGLSLATTARSQWIVQRLVELPGFEPVYQVALSQVPTIVLALAFAFLYWFLPNTSVRPFAAFLGGLVAAVGVSAALGVYMGLSVGAARAHALYGGFAQFPLFFVWVYVFWAIALFGAEIAFAYQNLELYAREVRGGRAGPSERAAFGLRIAVEVARAFRDTAEPWSADALSDALRIPVRTVREVMARLEEARIVAPLEARDREGGVVLGRPAESISVVDVLAALRGPRERTAGDPAVGTLVETVLDELSEGEAKAAAGQTLADLVARLPKGGAEAPQADPAP